MRRWLTIFLLVFLPLQLSWAAGSVYCQHETGSSAKHFGHHGHRHLGGDRDGSAVDDGGDASGTYHADCESCHLSAGATLPAPAVELAITPRERLRGHHPARYRSHTPPGPERPDITDLTPAVRFGGDVVSGVFLLA